MSSEDLEVTLNHRSDAYHAKRDSMRNASHHSQKRIRTEEREGSTPRRLLTRCHHRRWMFLTRLPRR